MAEGQLQGADADAAYLRLRQEKALPLVTDLDGWLRTEQCQVLPNSPVGTALAYAVRHWAALTR